MSIVLLSGGVRIVVEHEFKRGTFKQLILLLAQRSSDDPKFGAVKLNKLLYFCDFEAYRTLGRPITGARYQKEEYGPLAPAMLPIQDEMIGDGQIRIERREIGGHEQAVTIALHRPDPNAFSPEELAVIDRVLANLWPMGAVDVSEFSHVESTGWKTADIGDPIPYSSALFEKRKLSEHGIAKAQEVLARRNA
jgi:hypothetical protein